MQTYCCTETKKELKNQVTENVDNKTNSCVYFSVINFIIHCKILKKKKSLLMFKHRMELYFRFLKFSNRHILNLKLIFHDDNNQHLLVSVEFCLHFFRTAASERNYSQTGLKKVFETLQLAESDEFGSTRNARINSFIQNSYSPFNKTTNVFMRLSSYAKYTTTVIS